jgi:hypothetical protein
MNSLQTEQKAAAGDRIYAALCILHFWCEERLKSAAVGPTQAQPRVAHKPSGKQTQVCLAPLKPIAGCAECCNTCLYGMHLQCICSI